MLEISFAPDVDSDIPEAAKDAWRAGRIDLATQSATNLRYGYFEYPINFIVGGHVLLSATRTPLIDIMFSLAYSVQELNSVGFSEIDFTENTHVIRIGLDEGRVAFTSSRSPAVTSDCPFEEFVSTVRKFVANGIKWLTGQYPQIVKNPALRELHKLTHI
ncbi:hypothetical protein [Streptomyces nodosus]|uniref:Uncharacterized protein n=1 Tax=Streptomyces nodosus TaxID=40318 RepID=A0A5P2WF62_9ACTN|nr:hypothetical protein [Streptomyces nodosus]MBB4796168.1 hypothetical protein [Streptomyces nodosus]QEV42986.1 hypothetical protein CP978_34635 [Streptomyces nodosus]